MKMDWKKLILQFLLILISTAIAWDDKVCDQQLDYITEAIAYPRERWAIEMFDYWAKIQSGILIGNHQNFGHFDECLKFRHHTNTHGIIRGQHCMVQIKATNNKNSSNWNQQFDWREIGGLLRDTDLTLRSGFCLPAACSNDKVLEFLDTLLINADLKTISSSCKNDDEIPLSGLDIFTIILFVFIAVLLGVSTIYEIYMKKHEKELNQLITAFSLYSNGAELFDMTKSKSPNAINCLNGIRAISILWIILGHRRLSDLQYPLINPNDIFEWIKNVRTVFFQTDHLAVDTFFVMGALLLTTSFLTDLDKNRVSLWKMYLRRYLRYTPVLAILILYHLTLFKFTVSGPTLDLDEYLRNCKSNWWAALLHIQNYLDYKKMCLNHTWYLSADFQLFLVSPFLLYPAHKYGWKYLWTFPIIVIGVVGYLFIIAYVNESPVFYLKANEHHGDIFHTYLYFPTHARMGPWLIGMLLGFIFYQNRNKKIQLNQSTCTLLWFLSLSLTSSAVYGWYPFMQMDVYTSDFSNALYLATFRTAFATGVAIMIFLCYYKSGSIIRWLLSLPQWQPIGRMGLSIYLVHIIFQTTIQQNQRQAMYFSELSMVHAYMGDIIAVLIIGAILFLAIENPIIKIEKHFSRRAR